MVNNNLYREIKYLLLIISAFLVGCTDYDYKLSTISCRKLTYYDLPVKVQKVLFGYASDSIEYDNGMMLVDNNDSNRYRCEDVTTGPWIDYMKIIDSQKNIVYRIERDTPFPYIIYMGKLYIPNEYNIEWNKNFLNAEYSEYELK